MRALLGLGLLLLLALVAALFLIETGEDPDAPVEAAIGAAHFAYPRGFARDEGAAVGGLTERLDLMAEFPDFTPPRQKGSKAGQGGQNGVVLIAVTPKDDSIDPKDRPQRLYARFLESGVWIGPEGLILRRFEQGSPYDLEELYIAPPDGRTFFARCLKPGETDAAARDFCLFLFREDDLDVELRFAPALLEHWEALTEGAHAFLARIRAPEKPKKRSD
ncbi:MAG TPA: hypothetical protein VED87_09120 [Methylocystis sp.]|nr:hypothetical protein [Methylocystis sp.]